MSIPYVVSADVSLLMQRWATRTGFTVPPAVLAAVREDATQFMRGMFPSYELVPEEELVDGVHELVVQAVGVPVSLDHAYCSVAENLEMTRCVDECGRDRGIRSRPGTPPLIRQLSALRARGYKEIALVDDVVFSGELMERMITIMSGAGMRVVSVIAGVAIETGVRRIRNIGVPVYSVRRYREVIDEVCERDFCPGTPFSGRTLLGAGNVGVPYLLPFGRPGVWASIPDEWQQSASSFFLQQTVSLFENIEQCSGKIVRCHDLARGVKSLPCDATRFVDVLRGLH